MKRLIGLSTNHFKRGIGLFPLHSTIIYESTSFEKSVVPLSSYKKSCAVFDLDNTLMLGVGYKPQTKILRQSGLGSDIWFSCIAAQFDPTLPDFNARQARLLALYLVIQPHIQQISTENCVSQVLGKLKKSHVPLLGLTARSAELADTTIRQLHALGIPLSEHTNNTIVLDIPTKPGDQPVIYKDNIIFCSGQSKKRCLEAWLNTDPGKIFLLDVETVLYMDDKKSHCEDVLEGLLNNGLKPIVVHYRHVEINLPVSSPEEINADGLLLMKEKAIDSRLFHF